jgi:hypothetical protein
VGALAQQAPGAALAQQAPGYTLGWPALGRRRGRTLGAPAHAGLGDGSRAGAQTEGVWRHGLPDGWKAAARLPGWPATGWPLGTRLAALVFCLVTAGGAALTVAAHVVAGDYLTQQAHQQLRSYAAELTSRSFTLFPGFRLAPGVSGLGATGRAVGIAVLDGSGQRLITAGPPAPPAASGGWLEISEPVIYRARHIPFVYGADDSSFSVGGKTGSGYAGTLVIGLNLADVARAVGGITVSCLQMTGLAALLATAAAFGVTRILLRHRAPAAAAAAPGRAGTRPTPADVADMCRQLRRPLSVLAGLAEYHRGRSPLGDGDAERTLRQIADETERIGELVDQLRAAARAPEPENGWTAADRSGQAG